MFADKTIGSAPVEGQQPAEATAKKPEPPSCLDAFGIAYRIVGANDPVETKKPSCGLGPHAECGCNFN